MSTQQIRDDVIFDRAQRTIPDIAYVETFISGDTTPSVKDLLLFKCNTGVVSITNFDDGFDGQSIKIKGHANTTIVNGTPIKTNTGANKVLNATRVYTFTLFDNVWYEDE